ncbi:MAG: hypothetical protein GEV13_21585 [Rhodospirillales bacterium]|nr:hypothetical protein [Rhodospirillales bacterium]
MLARYRRLREIGRRHNSAMQRVISQEAVLQHARRLGLARGRTFFLDSIDELSYAFDLAIHTAPAGRSRAIDRYAELASATSGSDEMLMLDEMRAAHFSLLRIERRHEVAGLVATDLCRHTERWLIDVGLESSIPDGSIMATRLYTPERFSMTAGVNVPLDAMTMMTLIAELPQHMQDKPLEAIVDDRRFAETVYRIVLASGLAERVEYQDLPADIK